LSKQPIPSRSRRRASPEARRAQILVAALRCFSEKGYYEATMDDLAREAGLSKGSLYWHFKSKAEVFAGLLAAYTLELFQAWEREADAYRAGGGDGSVIALLGRIGELSLEHIVGQAALLRAWAEFVVHREVQDLFAEIYRVSRRELCTWIRRGIESGEIRDVEPESLAAALTAGMEGLLLQALVDPEFEPVRHWRVSWDVFARGIAA
jgi:AcrR family transcriptional regulator